MKKKKKKTLLIERNASYFLEESYIENVSFTFEYRLYDMNLLIK